MDRFTSRLCGPLGKYLRWWELVGRLMIPTCTLIDIRISFCYFYVSFFGHFRACEKRRRMRSRERMREVLLEAVTRRSSSVAATSEPCMNDGTFYDA